MEDFELTLALNGQNIPVKVHPHIEGESTYYDVTFTDYTLSIHKETMYTWRAEDNNGLNQEDIQTIGEQIDNRE